MRDSSLQQGLGNMFVWWFLGMSGVCFKDDLNGKFLLKYIGLIH